MMQMKIFNEISSVSIKRPIATIGIFDGVHLAHKAIISKLNSTAIELSGESLLVTLWPHPRIVLRRNNEDIRLLNTLDEKIEKLEETGVQNLIILPFDKTFAATGFSEFVREILVGKLGIIHLVVGYNHQFGRNREGNFTNLMAMAGEFGFGLSQQEPVLIGEERVSSSKIRQFLLEGRVEHANSFLGYPFSVSGKVVSGKKIGQQIGFPTANLAVSDPDKMVPRNGVYAVMVEMDGQFYQAMMNIGCRPTIDSDCINTAIEVNLFEFSGDIYGKELTVFFIGRIRDEKKFTDVRSLALQISKDKGFIKNILSLVKIENNKLAI
jgi:riboflavin kinase/FMN adenylyltransferase